MLQRMWWRHRFSLLALASLSWHSYSSGSSNDVVLDQQSLLQSTLDSATSALSSETTENKDRRDNSTSSLESESSCSLYLAPSSIKNAGYGVFTTKDYAPGDVILLNDGPNIPVIDPSKFDGKHIDFLGNVWWGRHGGMSRRMMMEADEVYDLQPMFGALPNYHTYLPNLNHRTIEKHNPYDDSSDSDAGAGAYSHYKGKEFFADQHIAAGEEIFLDYGENWLKSRGEPYDQVPLRSDYFICGSIIKDWYEDDLRDMIRLQRNGNINTWSNSEQNRVRDLLSNLRKRVRKRGTERTSSLLPKNLEELQRLVGGILFYDDLDNESSSVTDVHMSSLVAYMLSVQSRRPDWVRANGHCLDNIVPTNGPSALPHAGRGAMASRTLLSGSRITVSPLLHITDRDALRMYPVSKDGDGNLFRDLRTSAKTKEQLMVNYCFGHSDSSLLLCPVTNLYLINHCSARSKSDCFPNAKFQFATDWDESTNEWLTRDLDEIIATSQERLLAAEVIATMDIAAGEEIFLDYGFEWERAWESHLANWESQPNAEVSPKQSATKLNEANMPLNVVADLRSETPDFGPDSNVFTACWIPHRQQEPDDDHDSTDWKTLDDESILARYAMDASDYIDMDERYGTYQPCLVIGSSESVDSSSITYNVRVFKLDGITQIADAFQPLFLTSMPRQRIQYYMKPYRGDNHSFNGFRHAMHIPDELFPEQWRDRKYLKSERGSASFSHGDRVEVLHRRNDDGQSHSEIWIPGRVTKVTMKTTFDVTFISDGVQTNVELHNLRQKKQSQTPRSQPPSEGETVSVYFENDDEWFDAQITRIHENFFYSIAFRGAHVVGNILEHHLRPLVASDEDMIEPIDLLPMLR